MLKDDRNGQARCEKEEPNVAVRRTRHYPQGEIVRVRDYPGLFGELDCGMASQRRSCECRELRGRRTMSGLPPPSHPMRCLLRRELHAITRDREPRQTKHPGHRRALRRIRDRLDACGEYSMTAFLLTCTKDREVRSDLVPDARWRRTTQRFMRRRSRTTGEAPR